MQAQWNGMMNLLISRPSKLKFATQIFMKKPQSPANRDLFTKQLATKTAQNQVRVVLVRTEIN